MNTESATLITCLKDEAAFLIEWLAFHRSIGFRRFLIGANDCTDGSHEMLSRLDSRGDIEYFPFTRKENEGPQETYAKILKAAKAINEDEWLGWLDLDEFLNIHLGDGSINELLSRLNQADGIRFNWRTFGVEPSTPWPGRQLHPTLCRCSRKDFGVGESFHGNRTFKSLYKYKKGMGLWAHGPIFKREHIDEKPLWLRGNGRQIRKSRFPYKPLKLVEGGPGASYLPGKPTYQWAQINHYAIRHPKLFPLRRLRGRGGTFVPTDPNFVGADDFLDRHSERYLIRYNRTDDEDRSILHHIPAVDREMNILLEDEDLRRWHNHSHLALQAIL